MSDVIDSLPPIVGEQPKILILGSMPGKVSLCLQQYYAHPQNRFWQFLFAYFQVETPDDYTEKKALLTGHRIALWDVLKHCERDGSLDSAIKNGEPNDIAALVNTTGIRAVLLNGKKALAEFEKYFRVSVRIPYAGLPSTSPANARDRAGQYARWKEQLDRYL